MSVSSRFLGENLRALSKPTLFPVPSAVNSFPLLFSPRRPGEEAPRGLPLDSRTPRTWSRGELRPQGGGARRYPGRGGGQSAWGVRLVHLHLGNLLFPPGRAALAPPRRAPPQGTRPRVGPPWGQLPGAGAAGSHSPRGLQTASESREGLELFL